MEADWENLVEHNAGQLISKSFCTDVSEKNNLPSSCILARILKVQKLGEKGSKCMSIYKLYSKVCPVHRNKTLKNVHEPLCPREVLQPLEAFPGRTHNGVNVQNDVDYKCPGPKCLAIEKYWNEILELPNDKAEADFIYQYLLAATAKDCSIMVTFSSMRKTRSEGLIHHMMNEDNHKDVKGFIIHDLNERPHKIKIGVADLDPKPLSCIVKHYLRDNDMRQAYKEYVLREDS